MEVATVGPGEEVWERFGHVVLRISDSETQRDEAFDLGAAEFGGPRFIWDFFNGRALFFANESRWSDRIERFRARDRDIVVQRLALGEAELARLRGEIAELRSKSLRHLYVYDHVRDNCSTRLRDLLDRVTDGAVRRAASTLPPGRTYRDYTLTGEAGRIDALLFLDLIVGPPYDRRASGWDLLYLPSQLADALGRARIEDPHSDRALVSDTWIAYRRRGVSLQDGDPATGRELAIGFGLGVAALSVGTAIASRRRSKSLARALARALGAALVAAGLLFGLAGVVLWILVAFSRVPDLAWSENALLFLPVDFLLAGPGWRRLRGDERPTPPFELRLLDARLGLLAAIVVARAFGLLRQDNVAFLICAAGVFLGSRVAGSGPIRSTSDS